MKVGTLESYIRHADTNTDIVVRTESGKRMDIVSIEKQTSQDKAINILRIIVRDTQPDTGGES